VPWAAPLILPDYAEFKEGLPLKDLQFKEFLEYVAQQVSKAYLLPMTLVPGSQRTGTLGSGKEVEEDEKRYISNVCNDEKGMFEKQLTSQLFTDNENIFKKTGYGFKVANTTDLSRICFKFKRRHYVDSGLLVSVGGLLAQLRDRGRITTVELREAIKPLLPVFDNNMIDESELKSFAPVPSPFVTAQILRQEFEKEKETTSIKESMVDESKKEIDSGNVLLEKEKETIEEKVCKQKDCACHTLSAKAQGRFPVFGSKARDYNKIKNEISKIENESAKGIEDIIYRMVEKWFKELSEAFPGGEITSGNIVSKLKLKDKNILRAFIQEMLRKSWQSGSASQTQDPNVKKVMKMRGKAIDDAAGLWDYSIIDEMIDLISESQTDKITVDIITKLRQSVKDAIKKNRSVDELANEILASGTDGMLKKTYDNAKTEARTALAEARQQARFKTATERLGAEYVQFDAIIDDATTEVCTAANGLIFKADDPNILLPPLHYNCRSEINAIYTEQLDEAVSELPKDSRDDLFENPAYVEEVSQMIPEGF
jgi:SPP1 gp7 family putative phage head morphogenesis protein